MAHTNSLTGRVFVGVLVSLVAFPRVGPAQTTESPGVLPAPPGAVAEPTPPSSPAPTSTPASPPPQPASPFGPAAGTFPTLAPAAPTSSGAGSPPPNPFQAAPGVFPTLAPPSGSGAGTRSSPAATQSGPNPTTFPGLSGPTPTPSGTSGQAAPGNPTTPTGRPGEPTPDSLTGNPAVPIPVAPRPLTPAYGYGVPAPPFDITGPTFAPVPPAPPSYTSLPPITPGAAPIQAGDVRAPPILITPNAYVSEGYTDNPRNTRQTFSDSETRLLGGANISFDTLRLQGQLSGNIEYDRFLRAHDQNKLDNNLLGYGLGTVVPDHIYIDGRAAVTQLSQAGGVGFANSNVILPSQQTQAFVTSLSPIARTSFGDYVDTELRYTYGLDVFNNGSLLNNTASPAANSLSNITQNDVTLSVATGRAFSVLASKLTLDATKIDSASAARSTQLQAYDDLEYAFNTHFAALARVGYEDLRYPLQPAATTTGPIWLLGGRYSPAPGDYVVLRYGLQSGIYGLNGSLRYQLTARTNILASYSSGLSSSQQDLLTNLDTSQLAANGTIVNSFTGLPSALSNPAFAYSANNIFRSKALQVGIQTGLDRDTFGLNAVYSQRNALGPQPVLSPQPAGVTNVVSGSDTSYGVNLNWSHILMPALTGSASLGYVRDTAGGQKTLSSDLTFSYTFSDKLSGVLHYQFVNVSGNTVALTSGATFGPYTRNLVEIALSRNF